MAGGSRLAEPSLASAPLCAAHVRFRTMHPLFLWCSARLCVQLIVPFLVFSFLLFCFSFTLSSFYFGLSCFVFVFSRCHVLVLF